jgi:hypothetical protein
MPSSRPNTIPIIIHLLRQLKPQSILDVGVGFGKWGHLFREYTDILEAEREPPRYRRENWRVRIDGIEGHAAYLTDMHRFLYNEIHLGDAGALLKALPNYDLIFLGDILEHFEKAAGKELLQDAFAHAGKAVIVSTPKFETEQEELCGNELERHRSLWSARELTAFPGTQVITVDEATLLAVATKPGVPQLELTPPRQPSPDVMLRLSRARREITEMMAKDLPFVLVDDEHIRSTLSHSRALPFLEKLGQYWGPPPDDATAIRELERMRADGARFIVFIWATYWWLERYTEFERHLRERFACVRENDSLVIFDLAAGRGAAD